MTNADRRARYAADPAKRKLALSSARRWRRDHPKQYAANQRRHRYKRVYGISVEWFDTLLADQNGRCKICTTDKPRGRYNQWHLDHNHVTHKIRGILCNKCNAGLGFFHDDAALLRAAANYCDGNL